MANIQIRYIGPMHWARGFLVVVLFVGACTKTNEEKYCTEQTCTTPDFPFCDVTGFESGEPGTCVAVACTAAAFGECRGDAEVRCNATGNNYEVVQCERGCDAAADGCRLCSPNETACTNGTLAMCDAAGTVVSKKVCPLGCFESEPRCRDIAPSNALGTYLDVITNPPDLDLSGGGSIVTGTGQIFDSASNPIVVPNFLIPAPANGAAIRVFVAKKVRLGNVTISSGVAESSAGGGPALAIVADAEISIDGLLTGWSSLSYQDGMYAPGALALAGCVGGPGSYVFKATYSQELWAASGGGGHATPGGYGGGIEFMSAGGSAGAASGNPTLEPLRGGCPGGPGASTDPFIYGPGGGGAALQLSSRISVTLSQDAIINANGGPGVSYVGGPSSYFGGGAGGGILLEAPSVTLAAGSKLLVNGGPAASGSEYAPPTSETTAPSLGGTCTSNGTFRCANGGNGAAADGPATGGEAVAYTTTTGWTFHASGGGGGLGFIRINTATGSYEKTNTTVESGVLTTGALKTR
jgi:hypothetical protein